MNVREVPGSAWPSFLESFSQQHHGWLVTVTRGEERLVVDEPLHSVRPDDGGVIIHAGDKEQRVDDVRVIRVSESGGAIGHVEISGLNQSVVVRFREVMPPELVDGMP